MLQNRSAEALAEVEATIELVDTHSNSASTFLADAWRAKAQICRQLDTFDRNRELDAYNHILDICPSDIDALCNRGELLQEVNSVVFKIMHSKSGTPHSKA